jgi:hypothetical protein
VESVYGIGMVTATRSFQLKLGVTSTIRRLFVREGDQVRRGQQLADLDGVPFSAPFDGTITLLPFTDSRPFVRGARAWLRLPAGPVSANGPVRR